MLTRAASEGAVLPPSEPDVLDPPADVVADVGALRAAVDQVVPAKRPDGNLLIGTWNIRASGDLNKDWVSSEDAQPKRNFRDLHSIAAVASHFDVVAVQEVRGNIRALRYLLRVLGNDWGFMLTDVTKGAAGDTGAGAASASTAGRPWRAGRRPVHRSGLPVSPEGATRHRCRLQRSPR
jgi:hypothetical protein